ncbi:MAG TPA: DUF1592 domain-containing protein [Bdellovibrionales bacterium]|nr:DUF1592 domain-containing protein [Bdellovibrionales bacterium]
MKTQFMSAAAIVLLTGACAQKGDLRFGGSSSGSSTRTEVFACSAPGTPGATEIQRLTKYELINTIKDIFGDAVAADAATRIAGIPNENLVSGFDTIERSVSATHIQAYFDLSVSVATHALSTTARMSSVTGACFQQTTLTDTCLTNFVRNIGLKVFRRPLTAAETDELKVFYSANAATRKEGVFMVLARLLQSPEFLYRLEGDGALNSSGDLELTSYELASRLSYTLWGSMPDAELFAAAADNSIKTDDGLKKHLARLLASSRAKTHIRAFYSQWLKAQEEPSLAAYSAEFLGSISKTGLATAMKQELESFVDHIIWTKGGSVNDLLLSSESFVSHADLAKIYGVTPWTSGPPVSLPPATRAGVLTRAAFLNSGDDETHPFRRGSKVLSRFLCYDPPRPDSSTLPDGALDEPEFDPLASTRERFEAKTLQPACMGCHSKINPFSFALESYDAIGRHRTIEDVRDPETHAIVNSVAVNALASYVFSEGANKTFNGPLEMSQELASSGDADVCFVRQWYRFSRSKSDNATDNCALRPLYDALTSDGGSVLKVIETSVMDPTFRLRRLKK